MPLPAGGGVSAGASWKVTGTAGQADTGTLANGPWRLAGGFWAGVPAIILGDLNCDGHVDFADINAFVLVLSDPAGYQNQFPACPLGNGDVNGDGRVDFADINPFVALLMGG